MRLNADFSKRVVIDTEAMPWEASPMPGVKRRKLDRIGEEVARATSLVKYDPDSYFSAHTHGGGEEFFVLEGVFSDEHGDYPAGTYVRNPIGSSHTPRSEEGCIIFVKVFNPHRHFGGEEILVLDGVFSDENGDYPKGTWLRSPHMSMHRPFSKEGCLIYVKTGHLPIESLKAV